MSQTAPTPVRPLVESTMDIAPVGDLMSSALSLIGTFIALGPRFAKDQADFQRSSRTVEVLRPTVEDHCLLSHISLAGSLGVRGGSRIQRGASSAENTRVQSHPITI